MAPIWGRLRDAPNGQRPRGRDALTEGDPGLGAMGPEDGASGIWLGFTRAGRVSQAWQGFGRCTGSQRKVVPGRGLGPDRGMDNGVIYVATGPDYRALAQASARSLRAVEPGLAVDLFTDDPAAAEPGLFDAVHEIADPHPRSKLDCMAKTRFERTLFLDADTLVLSPLGDLFDVLERFELALAHDVRRASALIRTGHAVETPYAFPQLNSGVLLYRRSAAMLAFLADWARRFAETGGTRDQPVLRDMLWQSDLRFWVLPPEFNLRRVTMLDAWEPEDAVPTVLHSHRLMDHMRGAGARITDVAALVEAERAALKAEWDAVGGRDADPVAQFTKRSR